MTFKLISRRVFLQLAATGVSARAAVAQAADFSSFVQGLWPAAQAAGVTRQTFDTATWGLTPEPSVLNKPQAQAEFTISIPAYLAGAVTNGRVARGQAVAREFARSLARAQEKHGAPGEIVVAILGVESNFGSGSGDADTLRVLATLAWKGHRAEKMTEEFVAALVMLEKGYATRGQMRGSWAGAMGQPQFLPSAYLKFAESDGGDRAADIWRSTPDAIASIANFLHQSGWTQGLPPAIEIRLPDGYDYAEYDLDLSRWRALGVTLSLIHI
ncbi:MAG: lytic murein transglycosylase, partial [Methylocystis sp.]|nr:lytic murein transglycosylase [Methylocystis sp.]